MNVIYWRCEAKVFDIREFKDGNEFTEWFERQLKIEPTIIVNIDDANERWKLLATLKKAEIGLRDS